MLSKSEFLKNKRKEKNIKQSDIPKLVNIGINSYSNFENGDVFPRAKVTKFAIIEFLTKHLKLTGDELDFILEGRTVND